jgi:iron complex transport system substrate-binding protein
LRIVSLVPSATEIVAALGLGESLVGVTHECDWPRDVIAGKPVVTSSLLPRDEGGVEPLVSGAIDERVRAALKAGDSLYRINHDLLKELKPDLVLTQGLCDVCAVNHKAVVAAVEALGEGVTVLDLTPTSLKGVLDSFRQVGAATNKVTEAELLCAQVWACWQAVKEKTTHASEKPRTLLLEWSDPPYSAGHWNPELLTLAGATLAPWDEAGSVSRTLNWEDIRAFAPEMIVFIPCGFGVDRAIEEAYVLADSEGWFELPAVKNGECYAVDGNSYFNRPGPRLAESAEILATVLHPDRVTEMLPPYSVRRFPEELLDEEVLEKLLAEIAAQQEAEEAEAAGTEESANS